MNHPNEDLLTMYTVEPALVPERAELEAHLRACTECQAVLADIREFEALLADEMSWPEAEPAVPPPALREMAARARWEDEEAERLLAPWLDASPAAFVFADLTADARLYTVGVVRKLAEAAEKAWYSNPRHALNLAETAIAISGMLPAKRYSPEELAAVKGTAWKQRANALRHLGRFADARDALDRAERLFQQLSHPELELASIQYIRATTYNEQQQYDLAERYAAESTAAFARLGQMDHYQDSRLLEGFIAFEQRDLVRAQEIWEPVHAYGEAKGDANRIALGALALGNCALERGHLTHATQLLHTALLHFRKLGSKAGEIRCRWGFALITRREGRPRASVPQLRAIREEFLALGAVTDAALVTIDLMETFLDLGMARDVQRTAGDVVTLFKEHGMLTGAITAADYLKRAAVMRGVTPGIIDYVRKYLRRVEAEPDFAFVAPAPL